MARLGMNSCHFQLVRVKAKERVGESKIEKRQECCLASSLPLVELLLAKASDWSLPGALLVTTLRSPVTLPTNTMLI